MKQLLAVILPRARFLRQHHQPTYLVFTRSHSASQTRVGDSGDARACVYWALLILCNQENKKAILVFAATNDFAFRRQQFYADIHNVFSKI